MKDQTGQAHRIIDNKLCSGYLWAALECNKRDKGDDKKIADSLIKRVWDLRTLKRVENVLRLTRSHCGIKGNEWDSNPNILGCINGVIDLRTGELRNGKPDDYIRKVVPHPYYGLEGNCPRFKRFLDEMFEDRCQDERAEIIDYLQILFGSGITGHSRDNVLPIFYGEQGRNGKDSLLKILEYILGPYVGPAHSDIVMMRKGRQTGSAEPHLYDLQGKRMVWVSETAEGDKLNAQLAKFITGGGRFKCRPLNGNMVEFDQTHLPIIITNHRPIVSATDDPLWERFNLISLNMRFVSNPIGPNERKKDIHLIDELMKEASGILGWIIEGSVKWYKQGALIVPDSVRLATQSYRDEMDTFGRFINEGCELDQGKKVKASTFYQSYMSWCKQNGLDQIGSRSFGELASKRFKKDRDSKGAYYFGIEPLEEFRESYLLM